MRGFYVVKNPLVKPSLSINERFSTIEGSTIEGFQCTSKKTNYIIGGVLKLTGDQKSCLGSE